MANAQPDRSARRHRRVRGRQPSPLPAKATMRADNTKAGGSRRSIPAPENPREGRWKQSSAAAPMRPLKKLVADYARWTEDASPSAPQYNTTELQSRENLVCRLLLEK